MADLNVSGLGGTQSSIRKLQKALDVDRLSLAPFQAL